MDVNIKHKDKRFANGFKFRRFQDTTHKEVSTYLLKSKKPVMQIYVWDDEIDGERLKIFSSVDEYLENIEKNSCF